ncbi:MAG: alpha-glucan family phosphorylase [Bacteroidota bacterium]|jgi:starch phosphorylase
MLSNNSTVAYFSMEYAIDQALKIYSGGLGFLAGSHLRSAHALNKNLIGIGILWKHGYYDQDRNENQEMVCTFRNKSYHFLEDTLIKFTVNIHDKEVWVKAFLLKPETFGSAPLYLLSTDVPENDFLSQTITHNLYDKNEATRIAQSIILGIGGGKLIDILNLNIQTYHLNEAHALPLAFYLFKKYDEDKEKVKQKLVFTTHTPEVAGNEERNKDLLAEMHFFGELNIQQVEQITNQFGLNLNYTLAALQLSRKANAVSQIHGNVSREMWKGNNNICEITHITNAQNQAYWQDNILKSALDNNDFQLLELRKKELKSELFQTVANQTGKLFDKNILTIVWARRFAGYKRADLLLRDLEQFNELIHDQKSPIQIIWAGKPYPFAQADLELFHSIQQQTSHLKNVAVLTGYELALSAQLKKGADIWLNTPRFTREASGTSGMSAAMNGAINFSIPDGWVAEFAKHNYNSFVIPVADELRDNPILQEIEEGKRMYAILNQEVKPTYYQNKTKWLEIMKNSMLDVTPQFDSDRMVNEYFEKMY